MSTAPRPPAFTYAHSADGTSLAYMRLGSGPALVIVPPVPLSNISGDWSIPLMRDVFGQLSADLDLILYDGRGTGASQRSSRDLSTDAQAADLEAVLDHAGVDHAALLAIYLACPAAVTFAAEHPERVDHLVLFGASDRGDRAMAHPGTRALLGLINEDWELFTKTAALDWMGWSVGDAGYLVAESFRGATTPEIAGAALAAYGSSDLRPRLPQLNAPTLLLHRREGRQVPMEQSGDVASLIPNARLHVLDGNSATLFFDDPDGTVDVIADFISPDRRTASRAAPEREPSIRAPSTDGVAILTAREIEVLSLIAAGESNAEIAHQLGLSVHTVERHAANIYRKIDARGRADATAWALRNGVA